MPLRDDDGPRADAWTRVEPGAPLGLHSMLTLDDAEARADVLAGRDPARLAIHIANDAARDRVAPWFGRVGMISIEFPGFSDGRGFSLARSLRTMGYSGRLRAAGPVIADQYAYLRACGFDEVETPEALGQRQPEPQWAAAAARVSLAYQRGYPGKRNILEARRAAKAQ
ncbi:MAG: DUF934 domain-containing protein [Paracoccaceae bacterium]